MNLSGNAFLLYAIIGAVISVYVPFVAVGYARFKLGYDKSAPRAMFDKLPPYAQRATWAHQNSFEALSVFTPAALMAYITGVESNLAAIAAIGFVIVRLLYSLFYILDIPTLRSLMFGLGSLSIVTLFVLSLGQIN
ncbi:MAG: MAPEG family protein [Cyanobacteria bacterium J083]|nr:MAG: MAPEG family protein [Cyanobacteria bacterium J083]